MNRERRRRHQPPIKCRRTLRMTWGKEPSDAFTRIVRHLQVPDVTVRRTVVRTSAASATKTKNRKIIEN